MKFNLILLLSLAVLLSAFMPAIEAAVARRRGGRTRGRATVGRRARPALGRRGRMQARRGRQDDGEVAAPPAEGGEEEEGEEIPPYCNPDDPMGAWLLFPKMKIFCGGLGYESFGRYGSLPAEDEEAEDTENAV